MLDLGVIGFAQPWLLLALVALPALWWLLRLTPPPPKREAFPAVMLLAGLIRREDSAERMPLWLLLLRLLLAALVILAVAQPIFAPQSQLQGRGPLVILADNGWSTAGDWERRQTALASLLDEADRAERPVMVLTTAAEAATREPPSFRPAAAWRAMAEAFQPQPWPSDLPAVAAALQALPAQGEAIWLSDGLEADGRRPLAERLQRLGRLTVFAPERLPTLLAEPEATATGLTLRAQRLQAASPQSQTVQLIAGDGRVLASTQLGFAAGEREASIAWTLPRELINQGEAMRIAGVAGAGGMTLLDDRWRRRLIGVLSRGEQVGHPLLDPDHYLASAFAEIAAMEEGGLESLLARRPSVIVVRERLTPGVGEVAALEAWLANGGALVRFASAGLADLPDEWLPVRLRRNSRALGGALSWEEPQPLAPFPETSPFAGLQQTDDVLVNAQVLAEPSPALRDKTWASLADGTPLVTAEKRGEGWVVLFHVTADASWSSLPLSGLFLRMLERLTRLGHGQASVESGDAPLPPRAVLDGFGVLQEPGPDVRSLPPRGGEAAVKVGPSHPPGLYGGREAQSAWNLAPALGDSVRAADGWPTGVAVRGMAASRAQELGPWLLLAAVVLLLVDTGASLLMRGVLRVPGRSAGRSAGRVAVVLAAVALGASAWSASEARAQASVSPDALAGDWRVSLETHLAYVQTGNSTVDKNSLAGLRGLSTILAARTSVEPGEPVALDLERDELSFYPMIYWPVRAGQALLSDAGRERVSQYLERGGTIVFDTQDQDLGGSITPAIQRMRELLAGIRIPPLEPVPSDHVLTRSFYLLPEFPGRWEGGTVWIEANAAAARDGVSSVLIGRHDWAAAWAMDASWRPLFPVYPGGVRQREHAYRFGVNLVMHVLTGNYKGDQVHIPDILERLGQ